MLPLHYAATHSAVGNSLQTLLFLLSLVYLLLFYSASTIVLNLPKVLYTDKPLVVCAPTGSGKTVIFELAIVHLLLEYGQQATHQYKVVYCKFIARSCSKLGC